jgi:hypothetical protein
MFFLFGVLYLHIDWGLITDFAYIWPSVPVSPIGYGFWNDPLTEFRFELWWEGKGVSLSWVESPNLFEDLKSDGDFWI